MADQTPGEGKLAIFNLGEKGVVNFKDPLHVADGELIQSQNAVANHPDEGTGGLEKRGGMTKVNAVAMAGAVQGIVSVPLPDPSNPTTGGRTFYWADIAAGFIPNGRSWRSSTDAGLTWGLETEPPAAVETYLAVPSLVSQQKYGDLYCASKDGKLYYPGFHNPVYPTAGYQAPRVRVYDGIVDAELCKIPYNNKMGGSSESVAIVRVENLSNQLYVVALDDYAPHPNQRARVFLLDGDSGALTLIGNAFGGDVGENPGGSPQILAWHGGRLWAGTINGSALDAPQQGSVFWIRPLVDATWTLDHTLTANQGDVTGMVEFNGDLYVGTSGFTGVAALVLKRTPAGVWSTALTGSKLTSGPSSTYWAGLRVYNGALYAIYCGTDSAGVLIEAWKFDGTSWVMDQTLSTLGVSLPGMTVVRGDALYVVLFGGGYNLWRKFAGTWVHLTPTAFDAGASFFGYLE